MNHFTIWNVFMKDNLVVTLLILGALLSGTSSIYAQDTTTIRGPISAIRIDGDRLLFGQGPKLVEAHVTPQGVEVILTADLKRHDIRAIATSQGITFVLSEDGLTTLDRGGRVLDFARS